MKILADGILAGDRSFELDKKSLSDSAVKLVVQSLLSFLQKVAR